MSDKEKIEEALESFKECYEAESDNRIAALDDLRFARLGQQWDEKTLAKRRLEGRPALTINRLPTFIRQVVNDARQNKPSIRVRPADSGADVKTADVYNGLIRNIEQQSNADVAYDTACDFAVSCGIGYFRVKTDYSHDDAFDLDILIERVSNPFTVYGDPLSTATDASDWMRAFVTDEMTEDQFKARWPGADCESWAGDGVTAAQRLWLSEDMIRVAEYWSREKVKRKLVKLSSGLVITEDQYQRGKALFDAGGLTVTGEREATSYKVTQQIMSGKEILEDTTDWAGTLIPIVPVYGEELNIEGKRHFRSLIRDAKDAQRMLNYWRTTSTELVALAPKAPWVGRKGFADGDARWETANTESHPYLEFEGAEAPQRQAFAGVPAGALQEALNASDDLKSITGIYDASLGARSNETSGRAIMARQREGDIGTFHFIDNLNRAIRYAGRVLIDLIPKVYDQQRIVRILGEDGKPDMVEINNGVVDLGRGKYDLIVQSGPSFTSRRDEFAQTMMEFGRSNPQAMPLVMDKLVVAMDFPDAETIANRFKTMLPPAVQQMEKQEGDPQQQVQQMQGQMQQAQQAMQQAQQHIAELTQQLQQAQQGQQVKAAEAQAKLQMHAQDIQLEQSIAQQKAAADVQLAQFKAQLEAQTKLEIARIDAAAALEVERMKQACAMQTHMMDAAEVEPANESGPTDEPANPAQDKD